MRCPKCFKDKPFGASHCPHCTQRVTNTEVALGEVIGFACFCLMIYGAYSWLTSL